MIGKLLLIYAIKVVLCFHHEGCANFCFSKKKIMFKICSLKLIHIAADVHNLENTEKRYDTMKIFKN